MHNPSHPGEFITQVYLEPNGLSSSRFGGAVVPVAGRVNGLS